MKKQLFSCLTIAVTLLLTACGGDGKPASESAKTATNAEALISGNVANKSEGYVSPLPDSAPTYKVAMMNIAPYRVQSGANNMGYEVDLLRAIGEQGGFKVDIKTESFSSIFPSIQQGDNDIAMFGLVLTPERQKVMLASQPYAIAKKGYLVKEDSPYQDVASLVGKRIATLENSPMQVELENNSTAEVVTKATTFLVFQTLFIDKADAAYGYAPALIRASKQFPESPSRIIYTDFEEPTVIYAGKDKQELMIQINKGIDEVMANGTYQKIYKKWFGNKANEIMIDKAKNY